MALTRTTKSIITEAPKLWRHLNGVFSIYKPSGLTIRQVQNLIAMNLCRDLNQLKVRPPSQVVRIEEEFNDNGEDVKYIVKQEENMADNVLVVGPRYQPADFKSAISCYLGRFSSGLLGINKGIKTAMKIRENRPIKVYHLTGKLGHATETHFSDSPVTLKASFNHVTLGSINSFLASLQASHQKKMIELCGVDMQSQASYELAIQGPLRPAVSNIPLIYSLRCIEFIKPYFTIEIHAVNESEAYLGILIHDIGLHLKSVAQCTQVRCIRQSYFTLDHCLVRRHWNLENLLNNMTMSKKLIDKHPEMLVQLDPTLREDDEE